MESIWKNNWTKEKYDSLDKDIHVQTAVVGAGLAGILTAYFLQKKGVEVIVLEAEKAGCGVTGNTTGKIAISYPNFYRKLLTEKGKEVARRYARASQQAVWQFKTLIQNEKIDCDYEEASSFIYSIGDAKGLILEYEALAELGINAAFHNGSESKELPFPVEGLLEFRGQAHFHPLKFLSHLMKDLTIYENTKALRVKRGCVETSCGNVYADTIVITSHYPIMRWRGGFPFKMHQEGSRVIALSEAPRFQGMYLSEMPGGYSFRQYGKNLLIGTTETRYEKSLFGRGYQELREQAERWYPNSHTVTKWSNQDCMTIDGLPYAGKLRRGLYAATGFQKWGMTGSMLCANLLADLICKEDNPMESILAIRRFPGRSARKKVAQQMKISAVNLIGKTTMAKETNLTPPRCPHLGCLLTWNQQDHTWDCPCHGSRFTEEGDILNNPTALALDIENQSDENTD